MRNTPQENFVDQIRHYFNLELRPYDRERIKYYLNEYREKDPIVKVHKKVVREAIKAPSYKPFDIKRPKMPVERDSNLSQQEQLKALADKICKEFGVTYEDLIGRSRKQEIAFARGQFCVDAYLILKIDTTTIGNFINRNRTIVTYWIKCAQGFKKNPAYIKNPNHDNTNSMRHGGRSLSVL